VIEMIATGQINLDQIISRVARFEDWNCCFTKMQTGEYVKAVLKPN
jgi:Zn-dependent alcohol dehydrogenase